MIRRLNLCSCFIYRISGINTTCCNATKTYVCVTICLKSLGPLTLWDTRNFATIASREASILSVHSRLTSRSLFILPYEQASVFLDSCSSGIGYPLARTAYANFKSCGVVWRQFSIQRRTMGVTFWGMISWTLEPSQTIITKTLDHTQTSLVVSRGAETVLDANRAACFVCHEEGYVGCKARSNLNPCGTGVRSILVGHIQELRQVPRVRPKCLGM